MPAAAVCVGHSMFLPDRRCFLGRNRNHGRTLQDGAVVKIDGQLFTEYLVKSGTKPILWPIIGPTGKRMTRDYPMRDRPGEQKDHPHQRSLWFTHGDVNGTNFGRSRTRPATPAESSTSGSSR